jgi:Arc/MetJ family transcription regulator
MEDEMARITIEIDDERLAEVKQLLHTEDDGETLAKAVDVAVGAVYQRRAARRRLSELASEGGAFGEVGEARSA